MTARKKTYEDTEMNIAQLVDPTQAPTGTDPIIEGDRVKFKESSTREDMYYGIVRHIGDEGLCGSIVVEIEVPFIPWNTEKLEMRLFRLYGGNRALMWRVDDEEFMDGVIETLDRSQENLDKKVEELNELIYADMETRAHLSGLMEGVPVENGFKRLVLAMVDTL